MSEERRAAYRTQINQVYKATAPSLKHHKVIKSPVQDGAARKEVDILYIESNARTTQAKVRCT